MAVLSTVLGFPRIGAHRELKKATEAFWAGKIDESALQQTAKQLRVDHWKAQKAQGVDVIASGDFSFYDQVLDHAAMFNVIPARYEGYGLTLLETYFAMARGLQRPATDHSKAVDVVACEMVKWFDSNYHNIRPEFSTSTEFKLVNSKPVDEYLEAKEAGIETRPVVIGPVSFLYLGKTAGDSPNLKPMSLIEKLLPLYRELLKKLADAGAEWVQIDEPILVYELSEEVKAEYKAVYDYLATIDSRLKLLFTTYFGSITHNLDVISSGLHIQGLHIDLVRAPSQLNKVIGAIGPKTLLSLGVVDGRNIWKTDLRAAITLVNQAAEQIGKDRIFVASSSSLLHTPYSLVNEKQLDPEIKNWFSFAVEKCKELAVVANVINHGEASEKDFLEANAKAIESRRTSSLTNDAAVKKRLSEVTPELLKRKSVYPTRKAAQKEKLHLPLFPTTTIGSFPQTKEIRQARNKLGKKEITAEQYEAFIEKEIQEMVKFQDEVGLDVYVHGEPERNDMVQYFGERLKGFAFTQNGWVQSFGSRYVRPPIVVGDVSRPQPMTVKESKYAVGLTKKPMKGMLTGPITILRWSFPRDDVPQSVQAEQIGLALRDEVADLEKAGISVIQVDEPALREGCPLRRSEWDAYLKWAVESFRLSTSCVEDVTQIHSHFCYSDFNDIFWAIKALDADVISIENSKSDLKLLNVFERESFGAGLGPGLYDIHSPRVPSVEEMAERLAAMRKYLPVDSIWLNPDCGLKTRQWPETKAALENLVKVARDARASVAAH